MRTRTHTARTLLAVLLLCLAASGAAAEERGFTILGINDVYRIAGLDAGTRGGPARVRALRAALEKSGLPVLLLHAGDIVAPSFLSRTYDGAQMIAVLNALDGAAHGVFFRAWSKSRRPGVFRFEQWLSIDLVHVELAFVPWELQMHGAGASCRRGPKGLAQHVGNALGVVDHGVHLGIRLERGTVVDFLIQPALPRLC